MTHLLQVKAFTISAPSYSLLLGWWVGGWGYFNPNRFHYIYFMSEHVVLHVYGLIIKKQVIQWSERE